jgi:hypothetical protein
VKTRLLLDSHVPADVAVALRNLRPEVDVQHVSTDIARLGIFLSGARHPRLPLV